MGSVIKFFSTDTAFNLKSKRRITGWICQEIDNYEYSIEEINIILCSDEYLYRLNQDFLNHDDYTDVITFDNSNNGALSGEIYISVDRIKENAKKFKVKVFDEFIRVIIHGVLHLLKYTDKTAAERQHMSELESKAILNYYKTY